jgi:hypothetical protein
MAVETSVREPVGAYVSPSNGPRRTPPRKPQPEIEKDKLFRTIVLLMVAAVTVALIFDGWSHAPFEASAVGHVGATDCRLARDGSAQRPHRQRRPHSR